MIDLDDHLTFVQRQAREWATEVRPFALELDHDPDALLRHLDLPLVACMAAAQIPPEYNTSPVIIGGRPFYGLTALERVVFIEEIACGDLGMLLACPGAPMSGVLVGLLGDSKQKEWFYGRVSERLTWTFFALTEPAGGSDAGAMHTKLTPSPEQGGFLLNGAKRYVGNATRAQLGVVFARTTPGPLGHVAVLVETQAPGFAAEPLDTIGLRAARLGTMRLADVVIPADHVLGQHLPATRRGLWAWVKTFNLLRPSVAAMGVGIARAAYEYVLANRRSLRAHERSALDLMSCRINAVRQLARQAAIAVDKDATDGTLASAAKVAAARLAENATADALGFFGPGARLSHPLLDKFSRDARGIELMEGTSNIQKLNLFQSLLKGRI